MPGMIPILNYPDIDGARYSRTSVDLSATPTATVGGVTSQIAPSQRIEGWTSWKYSRKLTPGVGWSHRAAPQTRTRGKFEPGGTLGLYMEDYILLERLLDAVGRTRGKGAFEQAFQLTGTLYEAGLGTTRWDMIGCRIMEDGSGSEKGNDAEFEVECQLSVMNIFRDGVAVVRENTPFGQAGVIITF
jgi:hypothetical protein